MLAQRTLALGTLGASQLEALRIQVRFRRDGTTFFATVNTSGRSSGVRELSAAGPSCEPLAAATAVMLAVLLQLRPDTVVDNTASPGPVNSASEPESASSPSAAQEPRRVSRVVWSRSGRREPGAWRYVALGAQAHAEFGILGAALGFGFGGNARLRVSDFELELAGFALLDRSIPMAPGRVEVGLAAASAGACGYVLRSAPTELSLCAAFLVGRFHGRGVGYETDREVTSLWLGGAAGAQLTLELSRQIALRASLAAVVPFQQAIVSVERVGQAYDASPLAAIFGFGPELRFW